MQDLLIAIIVSWILFRLFRPVIFVHWSGKPQANRSHASYSQQKEGEINVMQTQPKNKNSNDAG